MAKTEVSAKHLAITKANAQMVAVVAVASFITIFCLVAAHSLWSQKSYQSRVITAKQKAETQLKANVNAEASLVSSYKAFIGTSTNIIGGNPNGTGNNDGNNADIVIDALPSKYNFPALASSIEKILKDRSLSVTSITGTDDEVAQSAATSSATPQPVSMPFSFTVSGASYQAAQDLITTLEHSIRPIQLDSVTLTGAANNMQVTVTAHTYYQPEKDLTLTTQVVK